MGKILTYFSILLIVFDVSSGAVKPDCKNHKQTTYDSFVCVCTEAEPCDKLEGPVKTAHGVVTRWESSRDGARFRKKTLHFGQNSTQAGTELHVKVNRDVKHQEIFGFGGAFTDASGINILSLSPKLQEQMLRDYFSKDGLEYNVGRVPIGGSDYSARAYTYDDGAEDKTLSKFNLTHEDFEYKIPIILKAKSMATHDIRLFGSPWSAPAWMKTNNKIYGGGSIKGPVGSEYWQIYAKYFVHYLNAYKAHNITHWGITIQNEPLGSWGFNSMLYSAESMRDFLAKTLGPELERSGWGTDKLKVMIWDFNLDHDYIKHWVSTIFADKTAAKYAAGTAFHWYAGRDKTPLDEPQKLHPDKFMLSTEACEGRALGAWSQAENYGIDVLQVLLHNTIGWVDWNLVLDLQGGPNWNKNWNSAPMIVDPANHEYYRQPNFYALAHFSKFLPPGSVRIDSTIVSKDTKANVAAFRTPHDSTVVIAINNQNQAEHFIIEDSKEGKLTDNIEPKSINTYVYYD